MDVDLGFIDPDDLPDPDDLAVGGWTCPCGHFSLTNVTGSRYVVQHVQCPSCGTIAQIIAAETGGSNG